MALLNKELSEDVETIFFMTDIRYTYLSSSVVKEVAQFGGNIDHLVPEAVKKPWKKVFPGLICFLNISFNEYFIFPVPVGAGHFRSNL